MNKYYIIVPCILLVVFLLSYRGALEQMEAKDRQARELVEAAVAKDAARKSEMEQIAQKDAEQRQKERDQAEREKAAKKERDYTEAMAQLKNEADGYAAETAALTREADQIETQLSITRVLREKTNREVFDLAKQVELAKIDRRRAEGEIQRLIEMLAAKVAESPLAAPPPPPAQPQTGG